MSSFGNVKRLLGSQEILSLKQRGLLKEDEYAFVEGDIVIGENVRTQDKRVLGRAAELLVENGSKRVLKG